MFRSFVLVVSITSVIYLLSFSGRPISDDEQLFSSAARNLAVAGNLTADQMYGNLRLKGSYHGVEPAFPMLASFWYRIFQFFKFGHLQSLYLLPILYTSFSAGLLVILAIQFGYSEKTGILCGLLFGVASMAWPYAKTFFRETLISFLLLGGWVIFNYLRSLKPEQRIWKYFLSLVFLCSLLLLIFTKATMGVVLLGYLGLLWTLPDFHPPTWIWWALGGFVLLGSLLLMLTQNTTDQDIFYRFSGGFLWDIYYRLISLPHSKFVEAIFAPLFSPWKGLFWYSPICLLAIIPIVNSKFRRAELLILPLFILVGLLVPQALFYDSEWSTGTWGSRFLIPVIPLLIVPAFPFIQSQLEHKKYALLSIVFLVCFMIQLPAVIYNSAQYSAILSDTLGDNYREVIVWNFRSSPIFTQWQMTKLSSPDLLLWRVSGPISNIEHLLFVYILLLLLLSIFFVHRIYHPDNHNSWVRYGFAVFSLFGIVTLAGLILSIAKFDPVYYGNEYKNVCSYLKEQLLPENMLVVESYPSPVWVYLMNNECGQMVWYSLPLSVDVESDPIARALVDDLFATRIDSEKEVWLIEQEWINSFSPAKASPFFARYEMGSEAYFPELQVRISHYVSKQP